MNRGISNVDLQGDFGEPTVNVQKKKVNPSTCFQSAWDSCPRFIFYWKIWIVSVLLP